MAAIKACWVQDPAERPSLPVVRQILQDLLQAQDAAAVAAAAAAATAAHREMKIPQLTVR